MVLLVVILFQVFPRVEELFESRKPKDACVLAEISGTVSISNEGTHRLVLIRSKGRKKEKKIPYGIRLKAYSGQKVFRGDKLTDGIINPHDLLYTKGIVAVQTYLTDEVQKVYRSQGVQINTKHIEVIVRQMTRKVLVTDMGDSNFLPNEFVDIHQFNNTNKKLILDGKVTASGERVLLGITRSSLNTESFISAASFQQTANVLTKAAIESAIDPMFGLKENVIIGSLIPAGTGMKVYNKVGLVMENQVDEEIPSEELVENIDS